MKCYDVTTMQKLFDDHGLNEFTVDRVDTSIIDDTIYIAMKQKPSLCEYVRTHDFKRLTFKSGGVTYLLKRFYVNVGGDKNRIKSVYTLVRGDEIVDVMALYEFQNAQNLANDNLFLKIDEIIKEDIL